MTDGSRFVHIVDDVPELEALAEAGQGPVLLHALDGFLDAGNAAALATKHLLAQSSGPVVASFDVDAFYDYRARRPPMTFVENRYQDYEAPRLVVRLLHDRLGTPYLLLHGPEPDTHWEAFAAAVRTVVEHFDVRLSVALGAVPMAVPHTRPVMLTNHATRNELRCRRTSGRARSASLPARRHCWRSGWGSGGTTPWGSSRTSPTTSRSWTTRPPR